MPPLDHERCYAAASSRDARFDGWFVIAVRTTGIYCRPSCPAITPKSSNVEFHHTAAAAQQRGFRACKRCRPDATPGSPDWNVRHDVVGRAMRLIADGTVERVGVGGLARQLGYSERHLNRLLTDEVGAGPLAVARAQRAQTARILIETTDLRLTDVAFAAGFGSVRQFNSTIREVFASSPGDLRRSASSRRSAISTAADGTALARVSLRLPTRSPFAGREVLGFLGRRAIPGVESYEAPSVNATDGRPAVYRRVLDLPGGLGLVALSAGSADHTGGSSDRAPAGAADHVTASIELTAWSDLATAVQRVRRMLDLDADPHAIDEHLGRQHDLAALVRRTPGRRSPASVEPFETAIRAVIGQQVSVAGARTVAGRVVESVGERVDVGGGPGSAGEQTLTHVFPDPDRLASAPDSALPMPTSRRDTIRRVARAVLDGTLVLDPGADPDVARRQLLAVKGVGPWTADYVVMRGLGHPDVMLDSDLGVVHARTNLGIDDGASTGWAPWRSYAVHHLWASLDPQCDGDAGPGAEPAMASDDSTNRSTAHHSTHDRIRGVDR